MSRAATYCMRENLVHVARPVDIYRPKRDAMLKGLWKCSTARMLIAQAVKNARGAPSPCPLHH
jgi:hypothetical protein